MNLAAILLLLLALQCGLIAAYSVAFDSPTDCETIEDAKLVLKYTVDGVAPGEDARIDIQFNGQAMAMPPNSLHVSFAQAPRGTHIVRVILLNNRTQDVLAASKYVAFRTVEKEKLPESDEAKYKEYVDFGQQYEEARMLAEAKAMYHCATRTSRIAFPYFRVAHLQAALGELEEARATYQLVFPFVPNESSIIFNLAMVEYRIAARDCGWDNIQCREEAAVPFRKAINQVLNLNLSSVDAHHYVWEELGLTSSAESDESVDIKYIWLQEEILYIRKHISPNHPVQPALIGDADICKWENEKQRKKDPSCRTRKTLVIYARQYLEELGEPWGPTTFKTRGMGGANEAVIFMARELYRKGYHVEIYGNPPEEDYGIGEDGIYWYPFWVYDEESTPDVFVVWWHHLEAIKVGRNAKTRYVWVHYAQYFERYTPRIVDSLDGIFPLSQYHGSQLPPFARHKVFVSANGIDPSYYIDGPNHRYQLIYASHPFYGLDTLLKAWPRIKARLPEATINIYYGWTKGVLRYLESNGERGRLFKERIDKMMEHDGINYIGMVGAKDLAIAIANSSFYLYPCEIAEISSISLMRAQALGAIPITSRHLDSALPETSQFDLGPTPNVGLIGQNETWLGEWIDAVVDAVSDTSGRIEAHRDRMKKWARRKFVWSDVATQWDSIFTNHILTKFS